MLQWVSPTSAIHNLPPFVPVIPPTKAHTHTYIKRQRGNGQLLVAWVRVYE